MKLGVALSVLALGLSLYQLESSAKASRAVMRDLKPLDAAIKRRRMKRNGRN